MTSHTLRPAFIYRHWLWRIYFLSSKRETSQLRVTKLSVHSLQPVRRMSYFKGQDGGRSQVTSFYPSTPQTIRPPSPVRPRGARSRSTGEPTPKTHFVVRKSKKKPAGIFKTWSWLLQGEIRKLHRGNAK